MQKQLQRTEFLPQVDNQKQVERLNNLDSQAWLYLGVLERLGKNKSESHERIAKSIEALRQKRVEIAYELEPQKPDKYRTLNKLQTRAKDFFSFLSSVQAQKDFTQIEKIINELILSTKNSQPSETLIQDLIEELSLNVSRNAVKISPSKLGLVYRVEELLYSISQKETSKIDGAELDNLNEGILNELKAQRDILSEGFNKLLTEKDTAQHKLDRYSDNLDRLNKTIADRDLAIAKLQEEIDKYIQLDQARQNQITILNSRMNELNRKLFELQTRQESLNKQKNQLVQDIQQKQNEVNRLNSQLNRYSQIRILKGEYIGNLSNKSSKYHFNRKCPDWKMLVGEYALKLDNSREILSSSNSTVFLREGLGECEVCSGRRNSRRSSL